MVLEVGVSDGTLGQLQPDELLQFLPRLSGCYPDIGWRLVIFVAFEALLHSIDHLNYPVGCFRGERVARVPGRVSAEPFY